MAGSARNTPAFLILNFFILIGFSFFYLINYFLILSCHKNRLSQINDLTAFITDDNFFIFYSKSDITEFKYFKYILDIFAP